jgi:hypothetical protein
LDKIADPNFPGTLGYSAAQQLRAAAAVLRDLADERDALVAANQLWQSNVEGAIADTGDLPGDLTAWSAIRRLTAERDELLAELEQCDRERLAAVAELAYLKGKVKRLTAERDHAEVSALDTQVHLDRILDAIGDPDILRHISTVRREDRYYLRRIADAVDGPT